MDDVFDSIVAAPDDIFAEIGSAGELPVPAKTPAPEPGAVCFGGAEGDYAIWAVTTLREKARQAGKALLSAHPEMLEHIQHDVARVREINRSRANEQAGKSGDGGGVPLMLPGQGSPR